MVRAGPFDQSPEPGALSHRVGGRVEHHRHAPTEQLANVSPTRLPHPPGAGHMVRQVADAAWKKVAQEIVPRREQGVVVPTSPRARVNLPAPVLPQRKHSAAVVMTGSSKGARSPRRRGGRSNETFCWNADGLGQATTRATMRTTHRTKDHPAFDQGLSPGKCRATRRARSGPWQQCVVAGDGAPGGIRTPDQWLRKPLLYPAELRARGVARPRGDRVNPRRTGSIAELGGEVHASPRPSQGYPARGRGSAERGAEVLPEPPRSPSPKGERGLCLAWMGILASLGRSPQPSPRKGEGVS